MGGTLDGDGATFAETLAVAVGGEQEVAAAGMHAQSNLNIVAHHDGARGKAVGRRRQGIAGSELIILLFWQHSVRVGTLPARTLFLHLYISYFPRDSFCFLPDIFSFLIREFLLQSL